MIRLKKFELNNRNIMKNFNYKFTALILLMASFISCDSFLEEEPRDIVSPSNFFNTSAEVESAVNGLYTTYKD